MEIPAKPGEIQEKRDELGRFVPGVSGNPAGKPKGIKHMTTILDEAIRKVAEGTGNTYDKEIVKALMEKARTGDTKAIDMIFDRLEGKPKQSMEIEGDGTQILILPIELINKHEAHTSTSDNSNGHTQVQSSELRQTVWQDDSGGIGDGGGSGIQTGSAGDVYRSHISAGERYSLGGTIEDSQTDSGQGEREPTGTDSQN